MNLAILCSVCAYRNARDLPACANDHRLVESILSHAGKYDSILSLQQDASSSHVKSELTRFITAHKQDEINEVFFYFSGHGDFYEEEFYFLLSDYDEKRRQQTALSNAELDKLLKALSPRVAVKFVDACHSGAPYIKDEKALEKSVRLSGDRYTTCYFMFSSQVDEASYQDCHLSFFTRSFASCLQNHTSGTIRYKDIADYISDDFSLLGRQRPEFVLQADLTDQFCSISQEMRDSIRAIMTVDTQEEEAEGNNTQGLVAPEKAFPTLLEIVKRDSERFCTETEAMDALTFLKQQFEGFALPGDISELYEASVKLASDFSDIPNIAFVASWLDKNKAEFFVDIEYRKEEYQDAIRVPKKRSVFTRHLAQVAALLTEDDYETQLVTKTRSVPYSITSTMTPPFSSAEITMRPRYENIPWWAQYVVLLCSKSSARVFFSNVRLKERNWHERIRAEQVKWKASEAGLKSPDHLKEMVTLIQADLEDTIRKWLESAFNTQSLGDGGRDQKLPSP